MLGKLQIALLSAQAYPATRLPGGVASSLSGQPHGAGLPQGRDNEMTRAVGQYAPVFEKDGTRFIVATLDWVGDTEEKAWQIAIGGLPEQIILGFRWTKEIVSITSPMPHGTATLGGLPVAILSGPLFVTLLSDAAPEGATDERRG